MNHARPETLPTIAYLSSFYARASDSFIRGEIAQMRILGHTVHTFSIRRSAASEMVDDDVRREADATEYLLEAGFARMSLSLARAAVRAPGRVLKATKRALKTGTPGLRGRLYPIAYLLEAAYLVERLKAKGVRFLHNHIGESSASVAMLVKVLSDIPYGLTIHGPGEFDRPTLFALGEKIHHAAFTAGISQYGRSQLYRWSDHADWSKIHVVHCGLDGTFLGRPRTPVPDVKRLVCVGRLAEQKGQLLLIEALGKLAAEGVEGDVVLVGDGPLRHPLEDLARSLGVLDRVTFAGWKGAAGVREEILNARAMVLPSFAEGLPVVLMEALALGRPVISTYVAGIPELVKDGECGWLVPAGAVDALAEAMREALDAPPEQLERMGRAGAERAALRHNGATEAAKLSALICGTLGVHQGPTPAVNGRIEESVGLTNI